MGSEKPVSPDGLSVIEDLVRRERFRLYREAGLVSARHVPYQRTPERPFRAEEKDAVTILIGGLTQRHNRVIQAAGLSLGYRVETLPVPTKADSQTGREYADNGMCNPLYFTIGALINHLRRIQRESELSSQEIVDRYVLVSAGSCGPCRFGMYEAQYRLALRNSGFDGFRVITFQQKKLKQESQDTGLEFNARVFLPLFLAVMTADLLNELANQIRPYERIEGQTDRTFDRVTERVADCLKIPIDDHRRAGFAARWVSRLFPGAAPEEAQLLLDQLFGRRYVALLRECANVINKEIEVDFTRPKPKCKVTGEFWAQTTEGDGNFRMFSFLESQGAEVLVEPITSWFLYLAALAWNRIYDERGLPPIEGERPRRGGSWWSTFVRSVRFRIAVRLINREYNRFRKALGNTTYAQLDQFELEHLSKPYYNRKCMGGEGHLEIAKNIYYSTKKMAHMVVSLKPFGCLPSTQSDGAQAAVVAHYPDMNFIPIETSGEGDINAYSRVQMALGEAKTKCKEEFAACVERTGRSLEELRAYIAAHPMLRRPLLNIPQYRGITGRAANFVLYVSGKMSRDAAYKWGRRANKGM